MNYNVKTKLRNIIYAILILVPFSLWCIFQTENEKENEMKNDIEGMESRLVGPLKDDDPAVVDHLRKFFLSPPSSLPYNLSTDVDYIKRSMSYSWPVIYNIVYPLFKDEHGKFFVEAGGLDGEFLSNSLWLEKNNSWTGLVVEPDDRNFVDMYYKRRKCWISKGCFSSKKYPQVAHMFSYINKNALKSVDNETIRGGTVDSMLRNTTYLHYSKVYGKIFGERTFSIQCFPLYSYMLALNRTVIDVLSLDVQGLDIYVIETIPFNKIYVRFIVVEYEINTFSNKFVKYMNRKGFKLLTANGAPDYFFVNENETDLIERYKAIVNHERGGYVQEMVDEGYIITFPFENNEQNNATTKTEKKNDM